MLNNAEFDIETKDFSKITKFPKPDFTEEKFNVFTSLSHKKLTDPDNKPIDLLSNLIHARWASGQLLPDGNNSINNCQLSFMSGVNNRNGLVILSYDITLEDNQVHKALRMYPKPVSNGTIKGWLPWVRQNGAGTFHAQVGFEEGARKSEGVTFQVWVHYRENGLECREKVITQFKHYDSLLLNLTADLSRWADQKISIELRVDADVSSGYDRAVWVNPRIEFNSTVANILMGNFQCYETGNTFSLNSKMKKKDIGRASFQPRIIFQNIKVKFELLVDALQRFCANIHFSFNE